MRLIQSALLYAALAVLANPASADIATAIDLREGDMKKLNFSATPIDAGKTEFTDPEGNTYSFADYEGQVVLVNFWATWCAPCRKEMPTLEALQLELGGDDFQVVTIATGHNVPAAINRFFKEAEVENLPIFLDPKSTLAREMLVFGLPLTVLLDRNGQEIARLRGDADWSTESAYAVIRAVMTD